MKNIKTYITKRNIAIAIFILMILTPVLWFFKAPPFQSVPSIYDTNKDTKVNINDAVFCVLTNSTSCDFNGIGGFDKQDAMLLTNAIRSQQSIQFTAFTSISDCGVLVDKNGDGVVSDFELLSAIDTWVKAGIDDFCLLNGIDWWAGKVITTTTTPTPQTGGCYDSDGGKNPLQKGVIQKCETFREDYCVSIEDFFGTTKYLYEYYCDGDTIMRQKFRCDSDCVDTGTGSYCTSPYQLGDVPSSISACGTPTTTIPPQQINIIQTSSPAVSVSGNTITATANIKNTGASMTTPYILEMQVRPQGQLPLSAVIGGQSVCDPQHPENVHREFTLGTNEATTLTLTSTVQAGNYDIYLLSVTKCWSTQPQGNIQTSPYYAGQYIKTVSVSGTTTTIPPFYTTTTQPPFYPTTTLPQITTTTQPTPSCNRECSSSGYEAGVCSINYPPNARLNRGSGFCTGGETCWCVSTPTTTTIQPTTTTIPPTCTTGQMRQCQNAYAQTGIQACSNSQWGNCEITDKCNNNQQCEYWIGEDFVNCNNDCQTPVWIYGIGIAVLLGIGLTVFYVMKKRRK